MGKIQGTKITLEKDIKIMIRIMDINMDIRIAGIKITGTMVTKTTMDIKIKTMGIKTTGIKIMVTIKVPINQGKHQEKTRKETGKAT